MTREFRGKRRSAFQRFESRVHVGALRLLGLSRADRTAVVGRMFLQDRRDAVAYWVQILVSAGIATLGLALGSSAVVIGAMLIAPLMGPIVELGMALVLGSAALAVRSLVRLSTSLIATVGGAALLTLALPFHVVTPEIASRTQPTALDLLVAIFVAVAAAFTTVRHGSETTSAAAGAAIGIALVPPLCVIGFGVGTGDWAIAGGASLLFLTNLIAILSVSVLWFWALGFEGVDAAEWERAALEQARAGGPVHGAMKAVQALFATRYGRVLRAALPATLLVVLLIPLSRALRQVAWEVRARKSVSHLVQRTLGRRPAVQTTVSVTGRSIDLQLYVLGSSEQARDLEDSLRARIAKETGSDPTVRVVAVPDVKLLREAQGREAPKTPQPPSRPLPDLQTQLGSELALLWPPALGEVHDWSLEVSDAPEARLTVHYWGEDADSSAADVLGRALSTRLGRTVHVSALPLPTAAVVAPAESVVSWLPRFLHMDSIASNVPNTYLCLELPPRRRRALREAARTVLAAIAGLPATRVAIDSASTHWSARLAARPCSASGLVPAAHTSP